MPVLSHFLMLRPISHFHRFIRLLGEAGLRPLFGRLAFVSVCLTVILASLLLARAADSLIADKLRYLGLIPLGLGLYQLGKLGFQRSQPDGEEGNGQNPALVASSFYLGFGLALLANSSDSVIVLTPIFADLKLAFIFVCAIVAVVVAIALSGVAGYIGTYPLLRAKVEKVGHWGLPFLLIAIGLVILLNKPDDAFVTDCWSSERRDRARASEFQQPQAWAPLSRHRRPC